MFERFGISRIVVREVMRTLAAKGMITSKTRVGTRVADPTSWNWLDPEVLEWRGKVGFDEAFLKQLSEVRLAFEPAAARLAAVNRTDIDLARLRLALKEMSASQEDHQKFSDADRAFHQAIIAASHNPFFYSFGRATEVALARFLRFLSAEVVAPGNTHAASTAAHQLIFEAIAGADQEAASLATIRVINEGAVHASLELQRRKAITETIRRGEHVD